METKEGQACRGRTEMLEPEVRSLPICVSLPISPLIIFYVTFLLEFSDVYNYILTSVNVSYNVLVVFSQVSLIWINMAGRLSFGAVVNHLSVCLVNITPVVVFAFQVILVQSVTAVLLDNPKA